MKKKIVTGVLLVLIGIQFIQAPANQGQAETPKDVTHVVQVPANIQHILKASCYDCHSNHTNYPWYSKVNPLGWWLNHHIDEGKSELNFSDFAQYDLKKLDHKLEETAEEVMEGHMPLPAYTWVHANANLTEDQKKQIVDWVKTERQRLGQISAK